MIFSLSGGNIGIGFAIPSDLTHAVMTQRLPHGKVQRGSLGIQMQAITPRVDKYLKLKDTSGVVLTSVSGGPPVNGPACSPVTY